MKNLIFRRPKSAIFLHEYFTQTDDVIQSMSKKLFNHDPRDNFQDSTRLTFYQFAIIVRISQVAVKLTGEQSQNV